MMGGEVFLTFHIEMKVLAAPTGMLQSMDGLETQGISGDVQETKGFILGQHVPNILDTLCC